jgi:hypothetical protein
MNDTYTSAFLEGVLEKLARSWGWETNNAVVLHNRRRLRGNRSTVMANRAQLQEMYAQSAADHGAPLSAKEDKPSVIERFRGKRRLMGILPGHQVALVSHPDFPDDLKKDRELLSQHGFKKVAALLEGLLTKLAEIRRLQVEGKQDAREAAQKLHGIGQHIPFSRQRRQFVRDTGMRRGQHRALERLDASLSKHDATLHKHHHNQTLALLDGRDADLAYHTAKRNRRSSYQDMWVDHAGLSLAQIADKKRNRDRMVRLDMGSKSEHGASDHVVRALGHEYRTGTVNAVVPIKPTKEQMKRLKTLQKQAERITINAPQELMNGLMAKLAEVEKEADIKLVRKLVPGLHVPGTGTVGRLATANKAKNLKLMRPSSLRTNALGRRGVMAKLGEEEAQKTAALLDGITDVFEKVAMDDDGGTDSMMPKEKKESERTKGEKKVKKRSKLIDQMKGDQTRDTESESGDDDY